MTTTASLEPSRCASTLTPHQHAGFELGWDYAHHDAAPPAPYDAEPSPLRNGLLAGRAAFGTRTLPATRPVRQWLQLRLNAWLRGRSVELFQVTPRFLAQIDVSHCPITRAALSNPAQDGSAASIDRVRNDAGYAAGNLVVMSRKANDAKGAHDWRGALAAVSRLQAEGLDAEGGLESAAWARLALLCSFVEALPHAQACELPLRLLPPNRLRLFNPVQALQAMLSRQLLQPGWSRRISRFEELLPGKPLQRDFKRFFMALLPRVLEAGKLADSLPTRWAIEDAWCHPVVCERWARFARQLDAAQCESLLVRAAAHGLATTGIEAMSPSQATDGWNLASRGYVPHDGVAPSDARRNDPAQGVLAL